VVGLGAWSQWTTFTINGEVVGTSIAGPIPADVTRNAEQPTTNAANPKIKPSPAAGAAEPAPPKQAQITMEPADAKPSPRVVKVKRLPFVLPPRSEDAGAAQAQAPAQEQPYANAADPKIRPSPVEGAAEPAQPQQAKSNIEPADVRPSPPAPKVKPLPIVVERKPEDAVAARAKAPAEEQPDANAASPKIKPTPVEGAAEQAQRQQAKTKMAPSDVRPSPPAPEVKRLPVVVERKSEARAASQAQAPMGEPPDANAASPKIKPSPVERADARPSRPAPQVLPAPQVKPAPAAERPAGKTVPRETRQVEAAKQQPRKQNDRSAREQPRAREDDDDDDDEDDDDDDDDDETQDEANTRKAKVAKREPADRPPRRLVGRDDIDLRGIQAVITELQKSRSVEELAARLDALGRGFR
jgi:hypothetical protein